jgi:prophage regulatory protein
MSNQNNTHQRIIRLSEVIYRTGLSRSSIYNFMSAGTFPTKIKLGARSIGFIEADISDWISSKVAGALL